MRRVGISYVVEYIYYLFEKVFRPDPFRKHQVLGSELIDTRRQLDHTSAMDEFAKWAKLNRSFIRSQSEYDKLEADRSVAFSGFLLKWKTCFHVSLYAIEVLFLLFHVWDDILRDDKGLLWPWTLVLSFPFGKKGNSRVFRK
jgi:tail-anchored protein insertion receptor